MNPFCWKLKKTVWIETLYVMSGYVFFNIGTALEFTYIVDTEKVS